MSLLLVENVSLLLSTVPMPLLVVKPMIVMEPLELVPFPIDQLVHQLIVLGELGLLGVLALSHVVLEIKLEPDMLTELLKMVVLTVLVVPLPLKIVMLDVVLLIALLDHGPSGLLPTVLSATLADKSELEVSQLMLLVVVSLALTLPTLACLVSQPLPLIVPVTMSQDLATVLHLG
jgi:hypothetical protein